MEARGLSGCGEYRQIMLVGSKWVPDGVVLDLSVSTHTRIRDPAKRSASYAMRSHLSMSYLLPFRE